MKTTINYRVAVNQESEIFSHFEPCGEDLEYAMSQFKSISKELTSNDTIELQEEVNYSGEWEPVEVIQVDKEAYEVYEFINGYFGIVKIGSFGGGCVHGGDSACEDHYNREYIQSVFDEWDGELHYTGELYGYKIEE